MGRASSPRVGISIVVPLFNERSVLPDCLARLAQALATLDLSHELVFVDDGSEDGSPEYLIDQMRTHPTARLIRLSRNFGKEAALTAGLEHARGEAVIVMDADLQDPPELIPEMVKKWQSGVDVVLMKRRSRQGETWVKRTSAHLFYRLLNRVSQSDIPVDTGDFRLMSRRAIQALLQLTERNRYMKGLFAWIGMPTVVMEYDRAPRAAGSTKWDYLGLIQLALEGITSFSISPLRWATMIGLVAASLGTLFGLWIVAKSLFFGDAPTGYPSLVAIITFLGGIQLLGIGIVGEYVGKTYMESKRRPVYLIQDTVAQNTLVRPEVIRYKERELHAKA
ncbi:glycosyltransferase family 2 protein [Marinobacter caseinilyticus]|uniref:glycosyltransferase family 2 protein n=1 Tax=Marinobacter caseinilyticus TaxID=2692195 RepID=UPI001F468DC5|nr:glycosyltransferase family 2 protein [Marinobacter caseinilyticus]